MTSMNVKPVETERHDVPAFKKLKSEYVRSPDGVQSNLLIILHGLGDSVKPFTSLARSLKLMQTDVLVLQAPERIPLLEEEAYQWYESFDGLGELIRSPDPSRILAVLDELVDHLTKERRWKASQIHWFGFAQGGSVAAQFVLQRRAEQFGSLVSVSGPLLSFPTQVASATPVLVAFRPQERREIETSGFKKGFATVQEHAMGSGEGMPRSRTDWEPIMRFWSERLARKSALERSSGVFEIVR